MIFIVSYGQKGVGTILDGLLNKIDYEQIRECFETCAAARVFMLMNYDFAVILRGVNNYEVKESCYVTDDEILIRAFSSIEQAESYAEEQNLLAAEIAKVMGE